MAPRSDAPSAGCNATLGQLAELTSGSLEGQADRVVEGVARLDEATPDQVSFCALPEYRHQVARTVAAAVVVDRAFSVPVGSRADLGVIRVENPYLAVCEVVSFFFPAEAFTPGVHDSAVLGDDVDLGDGTSVGPNAVIGARCRIGEGTRIGAGCVLADGTEIGEASHLYPNVTVYADVIIGDRVILHAGVVLGADGFGYATTGGRHLKIPQVGGVVIEDDVEIGANTCIDRAALGVTCIRRGTKIDNLVQIGHNCAVGPDTILCGQAGLGGSTKIGRGVMVGGQAGLRGHLSIGDGVMIAGGAGVTNGVPAGSKVAGYPHLEVSKWRRAMAALKSLPNLMQRVRRLEAALDRERKEDD